MLLLKRRVNEKIVIVTDNGTRIIVTVNEFRNGNVSLAFEAPITVSINRLEVQNRIDKDVYERNVNSSGSSETTVRAIPTTEYD